MATKEQHIEAWHFLPNDMKLKHGDGRLVVVGKKLSVEGDIILCERGLHASRRAIDALGYTDSGAIVICRVECWGDVVEQGDKLVCRHRKVLWMYNAEKVLHQFAVDVAREVLDLFAKDSDDPAIQKANVLHRELLDLKQRWINSEISDSEWTAARDAAWTAARAAARDAERAAARDAARDAAWTATRDEAWDTAWDAARDAARVAAWTAAWDATRVAAWTAARAATRDAALDRLNDKLEAMLIAGAEIVDAQRGGE